MNKENEKQVTHLQLSKSSTEEQLKQYFQRIVELNNSNEEFPINLDDIWPIGYTRRDNAIRDLKNGFYEGEDYVIKGLSQVPDYQFLLKIEENPNNLQMSENQSLLKFDENSKGGRPKSYYFLSVSCAEYLIVRKCRPVFEVYRRIFHKVVNSGVNLMGMGKYYTITEYCQMFGKSKNSFYGLMANYREEFAMLGSVYYISKSLCKMLEMRSQAEQMRKIIRERGEERQLKLEFKED